jgi:hypothetical protein
MSKNLSNLISAIPELNLNHISVCFTLRERGERARKLWTRKGMPTPYAARLSEYWKKRATEDPELARRLIGTYLEHYSHSGYADRFLDCRAHPENLDLEGLLKSPGPKVARSVKAAIRKATGIDPDALPSLPPLKTQVASASKSLFKWASSGMKNVSAEELDRRRAICAGCEFWDVQAFQGTGRCQKCGCSTWAKLRMATEKCPIDKWGPVHG